jgi:beta-lactamase regulating signal transducer with metallopeptidase domain
MMILDLDGTVRVLTEGAIRTTLFLGVIGVATLFLGSRRAVIRHDLWRIGLLGALLLPWAPLAGHLWHVSVSSPLVQPADSVRIEFATAPAAEPSASLTSQATLRRTEAPGSARRTVVAAPLRSIQVRSPIDPTGTLLYVYATGVVLLLLRTLSGWYRVRSWRLRSTPLTDPDLARRVANFAARLGLQPPPVLALSDDVACPTQVGIRCPMILIPPSTPPLTDAVICHELAHIRSQSVLFGLIGRFVACLHWYNPFVWLALRAERMSGEQACDDWATADGRDWVDYAQNLVEAAQRRLPHAAAAAQLARPSSLSVRVRRILGLRGTGTTAIRLRVRFAWSTACGVALLGLGAVGAVSPAATARVSMSHAPEWEFFWLPEGFTVGGTAQSLNDAGQVAGTCWQDEAGRACVWSPGQAEPVLISSRISHASVISESGIAGGTITESDMPLAAPFTWADGRLTMMPKLPGAQDPVMAISNTGQVVGWAGGRRVPFSATTERVWALPGLGDSTGSARAINDDGIIVGDSGDQNSRTAPVMWHPQTGIQELWYPPRFKGGSAADLTTDGRVLVNLFNCDWGDQWDSSECRILGRPMVWTMMDRQNPNGHWLGNYRPLPHPDGYDDARGQAINDSGTVLLKARVQNEYDAFFLASDDQLLALPQPESGRLAYWALNNQGWLAGNLTVSTDGETRRASAGFIAKPRNLSASANHPATEPAAQPPTSPMRDRFERLDAFYNQIRTLAVDSTKARSIKSSARVLIEKGVDIDLVERLVKIGFDQPARVHHFVDDRLRRITTNPAGTNASRFVVMSVELKVADGRVDAPLLDPVEMQEIDAQLQPIASDIRSVLLKQLQGASVDSLTGQASRAAFFDTTEELIRTMVDRQLAIDDRHFTATKLVVTDMIIQ